MSATVVQYISTLRVLQESDRFVRFLMEVLVMWRERNIHRLLVSIILISLGCGCATPYQRLSGRFGYGNLRITEDTFDVTFTANGRTPWETVSGYVMRRAAEVTILHGFSHFIALNRADQTKTYIRGTDQTTTTFVRPAIRLRVRCFKKPLPDSSELIDARDFLIFNYPEALRET